MNENKYESIKKDYCIQVNGVNFSKFTDKEPQIISGESLTYNYNNGVVSFIDEKGCVYITPFYEIIKTLEQAGYKKSGLHVPFTDNEWLNKESGYSGKWKDLLSKNRYNKNENIDISEKFNIEENIENTMQL